MKKYLAWCLEEYDSEEESRGDYKEGYSHGQMNRNLGYTEKDIDRIPRGSMQSYIQGYIDGINDFPSII